MSGGSSLVATSLKTCLQPLLDEVFPPRERPQIDVLCRLGICGRAGWVLEQVSQDGPKICFVRDISSATLRSGWAGWPAGWLALLGGFSFFAFANQTLVMFDNPAVQM